MSWRHTASSWRHTACVPPAFDTTVKVWENITMKLNTKFCTHLRCVHSGHYSDSLCQKLPGDEFPAEIWQIMGIGFNWVQTHSQNFVLVLLPDITGRTALAVRPDVVNAKYHVITNTTYNRDPVPAKFKHVTNIDTCTLLCCDYSTLWEHVNMVEIGSRCADENVKILVSYQWIGWKRRTKMVGE